VVLVRTQNVVPDPSDDFGDGLEARYRAAGGERSGLKKTVSRVWEGAVMRGTRPSIRILHYAMTTMIFGMRTATAFGWMQRSDSKEVRECEIYVYGVIGYH
jgi:hypothetical protein